MVPRFTLYSCIHVCVSHTRMIKMRVQCFKATSTQTTRIHMSIQPIPMLRMRWCIGTLCHQKCSIFIMDMRSPLDVSLTCEALQFSPSLQLKDDSSPEIITITLFIVDLQQMSFFFY